MQPGGKPNILFLLPPGWDALSKTLFGHGAFNSFLHGIMSMLVTIGIGGIVIVRPHSLGHTPERHCQLGIEFRSVLK